MNKRAVAGLVVTSIPAIALAEERGPAGNGIGGHDEVILVAQVALLTLVGRGLGEAIQRFGRWSCAR